MSLTIRRQSCCLEFPQELSYHIFKFKSLRNDSSSLKHCSLVCRAWLYAARIHLFQQVILTPKNIVPFIFLINDSLSTIHSHVRKLELWRIDCSNRRVISSFTSTLTHLHLRDMTFNAFVDILDIICSFLCLQSVALDDLTVETSSAEKSARAQNKILPFSVNSVRYRGRYLRTFLLWLLQHTNVPKMVNFDVGPIGEESIYEVGKYLVLDGSALKHVSLSFDLDVSHHIHTCVLQDSKEHTKTKCVSSIARRYKANFGFDVCPNIGALTGLRSLHLDNFIHFEDRKARGSALTWGPRIIASSRAVELQEVILGVSLQKAGDLDKFIIRWDFLDEVFTTMDGSYANLASLKIEITGTVNMDGIASLIRSRLPGCQERGLLQFCRKT